MSKYVLYQCEGYEILEKNKERCIVYDQKAQKYYAIKKAFADLHVGYSSMERLRVQCTDVLFYALFSALPCVTYQCVKVFLMPGWVRAEISFLTMFLGAFFLVCNIVLHELAHYLMMKCYGRRVRFMRPKMEGRNIKFYVDTTSSYLLPKYKRFAVYAAGTMANVYFICVVLCLSGVSPYAMLFSLVFMILNFIPSAELSNDVSSVIQMIRQ